MSTHESIGAKGNADLPEDASLLFRVKVRFHRRRTEIFRSLYRVAKCGVQLRLGTHHRAIRSTIQVRMKKQSLARRSSKV